MDQLESAQQGYKLMRACVEAGIDVNRRGEYHVHIRGVVARHDQLDPAFCTLYFCWCTVELVAVIKAPSSSLLKRVLGSLVMTLFPFADSPWLDDQSGLGTRIHGDVAGTCKESHRVDILMARFVRSGLAGHVLMLDDKTRAVASDATATVPASQHTAAVLHETKLVAVS